MSSMFGVGVASNYPTAATTYGVDPHNSYYVLEQNTDASGTKIIGTLEVTGTITADQGVLVPQGAGGLTPTATALYSSEVNFYDSTGGVNTQAFKVEYDGTPGTLNIVGVPSNKGLHVTSGGDVSMDVLLQVGNPTTDYYTIVDGQNIKFQYPNAGNETAVITNNMTATPSPLLDIITSPGSTPPSAGLHLNLSNGKVTVDNGLALGGGELDMNNLIIKLGTNTGEVYYDAGNAMTVVADTAKILNTTVGNTRTTVLDASGFTVTGPFNPTGGITMPAAAQLAIGAQGYLTGNIGAGGLDAVFNNSLQIFSAATLTNAIATFGNGGVSVGSTSGSPGSLSCGLLTSNAAPGNYNLDWTSANPNSTPLTAQGNFRAFGLLFAYGKTATSDTAVTFTAPYAAGEFPVVIMSSANYDGGPVNEFSMATSVTSTGFTAHSTTTSATGGNCSAYWFAIGRDPTA